MPTLRSTCPRQGRDGDCRARGGCRSCHVGTRAGSGAMFHHWAKSDDPQPYNSWGNGSAMRVSPVGFAFDSLDDVLEQAKRSAEVTHNHPEGILGAQAVASAVFLARTGRDKDA